MPPQQVPVRAVRWGRPARQGLLEPLWRRVHTDSSYLSANDIRAHFGLGLNEQPLTVVVQWPDGSAEQWNDVTRDRLVVFRQGSGDKVAIIQ